MKSIKIIFSAFAFFALVSISNAQETVAKISNEKETAMQKTERYIKQLDLTEDQASKARDLTKKYSELIANAKTPAEKKNFLGEAENEVKTILTPEQYKKYYALKTADQNKQQPVRPMPARTGTVKN